MGFSLLLGTQEASATLSVDLLHRMQCNACPLNSILGNATPQMEPSGAKRPTVYILGEAPGRDEDLEGRQFVGRSGQILRARIPDQFIKRCRFNNVVRCRPPNNRTPEPVEIECCRPSVESDIEQSRPLAIFGFGNVPLMWVSGFNGIMSWRGRRMPVRIGAHACWYYAMLHPAFLLRGRAEEETRMFNFDMERAFTEVEDLPMPDPHDAERAKKGLEALHSTGDILEALSWASHQPVVGIDYETDPLRPYEPEATLLTAAVSNGKRAFAFAFDHPGAITQVAGKRCIREAWVKFLRSPARKVVHNLAFEQEWTGVQFGADLLRASPWEDTATQAAILDERRGHQRPGPFSLEFLVQQHFGFNIKKVFAVNRAKLINQPLDEVLLYNALDARYHKLLYDEQAKAITAQGLDGAYELGRRRVPTVVLSQMKGVPVDTEEVARLRYKYGKRIEVLEQKLADSPVIERYRRKLHTDFNPYSTKDAVRLFTEFLPYQEQCHVQDKYTKEMRMSVDESVLTRIMETKGRGSEVAEMLLKLRKDNKRKSTYLDPLAPDTDGSCLYSDGLLHANFNTFFAETGRLSCNDPNLQNFPKRLDEAREVRRCIRAPKGHLILAFDYGQIEARVIAMFTHDKAFCKALWERYDVHGEWAEKLARAYPSRVGGRKNLTDKKAMKMFRTDIKNGWTFPLFFGARLESASKYIGIPADVLAPLYDDFWEQFSGVKEWQERQLAFYEQNGYVECLTGRRRRGPLSVNKVMNSPVQGTAAEIVMDAMCRLSEKGDPELQPEINIHDDLTFLRVPGDRADEIAEQVLETMLEVPFDWVNVPISVELSSGTDWMDMKEEGSYFSDEWFGNA